MWRWIEAVCPVFLYICFIVFAGPWWSFYEIDTDEGINLMKAALVAEGYSLYDEIWSDQPPILTYVLALVHVVSDGSVAAARTLILASSSLLIWSLFRIIFRTEGRGAAWLAVGVLAASFVFQLLSVAVMVGLPAIALAVAALDHAFLAADRDQRWRFWLAGLLFAVSVHTKLFVLVVAPSLLLAAAYAANAEGQLVLRRDRVLHSLELLCSACLMFSGIAWIAGAEIIDQLIAPHRAAQEVPAHADIGGIKYFLELVWSHGWVAVILGIAGCVFARPWTYHHRLVPLLWFAVAAVVLATHRPLNYHQTLLIVVPLAWLSSFLVNKTAKDWPLRLIPNIARPLIAGGVVLLVILSGVKTWSITASIFSRSDTIRDRQAIRSLQRFAHHSQWVLTDRPIDAYRTGLLVPPPVAVFSRKRRAIGQLSDERLIKVIEAYRPQQINLRRFRPSIYLKSYLESHGYLRIAESGPFHYVDRQIVRLGAIGNSATNQ